MAPPYPPEQQTDDFNPSLGGGCGRLLFALLVAGGNILMDRTVLCLRCLPSQVRPHLREKF